MDGERMNPRPADLLQRLERSIHHGTFRRVRALRVEARAEGIAVFGFCSSYYDKVLALEAARPVLCPSKIDFSGLVVS